LCSSENLYVTAIDCLQYRGVKTISPLVLCGLDRPFCRKEEIGERSCPRCPLFFLEEDEFSQMVGVAQSMSAAVLKVGLPPVVDGPPVEMGQYANTILPRLSSTP
jgi:hypothetical protein